MKLPKAKFYPEAVPEKWDNIEYEAINEDQDGHCEPVYDSNAEIHFWSVYLHDVEGGVMCIGDLPSEAEALEFMDLLKKVALNFKNNGYL